MRIDLLYFASERGMPVGRLAREAEARGFGCLWIPDHSHVPLATGRDLPEEYGHTFDQFLALAVAAGSTTTLLLGTGVTLVAQHDPLRLAKQVATLDVLAEGRLRFGVGYGWNHAEMAGHGLDPRRRYAVLRENLAACRELWVSEVPTFTGDRLRIGPAVAWPKPVQRPHPPILIGGGPGPGTVRHLVEHADGWLPIDDGRYSVEDGWSRIRDAAVRVDRDPSTLSLNVFGFRPGAVRGARPRIEALRALGTESVVFHVPVEAEQVVLDGLDALATVVAEFGDHRRG